MNHMTRENSFAAALTAAKASTVDRQRAQALLGAQSSVLDEIFHELAGRAATGQLAPNTASQTQLLLAFKAQLQSRSALATLVRIKDSAPPPVSRAPAEEKREIETIEL